MGAKSMNYPPFGSGILWTWKQRRKMRETIETNGAFSIAMWVTECHCFGISFYLYGCEPFLNNEQKYIKYFHGNSQIDQMKIEALQRILLFLTKIIAVIRRINKYTCKYNFWRMFHISLHKALNLWLHSFFSACHFMTSTLLYATKITYSQQNQCFQLLNNNIETNFI